MIAISSHRPHSGNPEYAINQRLAHMAWEQVFSKVIYMGEPEPELTGLKTVFVRTENFPHIKTAAQLAASSPGFSAILNADIVVTPGIQNLEMQLFRKNQLCASSRRWNFRRTGGPLQSMISQASLGNDRGRDIFIAHSRVWQEVAANVPPVLRIGNPRWDAWMTDFFRERWDAKFVDFTTMRCVFHPNHEGRHYPYAEEIAKAYPR